MYVPVDDGGGGGGGGGGGVRYSCMYVPVDDGGGKVQTATVLSVKLGHSPSIYPHNMQNAITTPTHTFRVCNSHLKNCKQI